jgi:hypothetical protein
MIERSAAAESRLATLAKEPTENADRNDPTLPMDRADPIDPIDRIDPREQIDRIESSDLIDHRDPLQSGMRPSSTPAGSQVAEGGTGYVAR